MKSCGVRFAHGFFMGGEEGEFWPQMNADLHRLRNLEGGSPSVAGLC